MPETPTDPCVQTSLIWLRIELVTSPLPVGHEVKWGKTPWSSGVAAWLDSGAETSSLHSSSDGLLLLHVR